MARKGDHGGWKSYLPTQERNSYRYNKLNRIVVK